MRARDDHYAEIIERMVNHTFKLYKDSQDTGKYPMRSVRQVLMEIGVPHEQRDSVIRYIGDRGFTYCMDPTVSCGGERPTPTVCVWGADQLHSRLTCVL